MQKIHPTDPDRWKGPVPFQSFCRPLLGEAIRECHGRAAALSDHSAPGLQRSVRILCLQGILETFSFPVLPKTPQQVHLREALGVLQQRHRDAIT